MDYIREELLRQQTALARLLLGAAPRSGEELPAGEGRLPGGRSAGDGCDVCTKPAGTFPRKKTEKRGETRLNLYIWETLPEKRGFYKDFTKSWARTLHFFCTLKLSSGEGDT